MHGNWSQDSASFISSARGDSVKVWHDFSIPRESPLSLPGGAQESANALAAYSAGPPEVKFLAEGPLDDDNIGSGISDDITALEELEFLVETLAVDALVAAANGSLPGSRVNARGEQQVDKAQAPIDGALAARKSRSRIDAAEIASMLCDDVHPNAESPDMLHVVYSFNLQQIEGFRASVASLVASSNFLEKLTIHVMVQEDMVEALKSTFGISQHCTGTIFSLGFMVTIHTVDLQLLAKAVAIVPEKVKKNRGAIDSVENFARFYMHRIVGLMVVVYLDTDTIVQKDLGVLRRQLLDSGKTAGFVSRDGVIMESFLKSPKDCGGDAKPFHRIAKEPAFNVGVFVVNLKRWAQLHYAEEVETWVALHNRCKGKLWVGGSQPPLLLSFFIRPDGQPADFVVFEKSWNVGDLGWRKDLDLDKLRKKNVLHWNGDMKPWTKDGLYTKLWTPHHERFDSLMRTYDAVIKCPHVEIYDQWAANEQSTCELGRTYGCSSYDNGMWTSNGCKGLFHASGVLTVCGTHDQSRTSHCKPGRLVKPRALCGLRILTTFFTGKKDWQRKKYVGASYKKIQAFYQSTMELGLNVTIIYDELPDALLTDFGCSRFSFVRVDLDDFDRRLGVNDVRYFFFDRMLAENPSWQFVFVIDAFDAKVALNPCQSLQLDTLYVGSELDNLKGHPWMKVRFKELGGKYLKWYKSVDEKTKILNCGITGGHRLVMQKFFASMIAIQNEVLAVPNPHIKRNKHGGFEVNVNMPALNYIGYNDFAGKISTNVPVHSEYKKFQDKRKDVWFIHK